MLSIPLALLLTIAPESPLRLFLRGGPKTHGPNQHEHERFVAEWKDLLASRGAVVDGALRFPTADELARTDVLVMYAADGGSIHGDDRAHLEAFLARGGGLAVLHDAVCSDDPTWFQTIAGGAWEWGHSKWHEGLVDLYFTDRDHPITRSISNFRFQDEIYTDLHLAPEAKVLVRGFHSIFEISPQAWIYEKGPYRAFVSIQGHEWSSFSHPAWRALVLRGIAWAGRRDVDLLLAPEEKAALRYPPGGPMSPESAASALVLHPDFDLSLVAAEPLVAKPISIDWDARGRMWIAETPGYPEKERYPEAPARDDIAVLEDRDGDGRMDAKTVFMQGIDLVTSLVLHRDGAIVAQAGDIRFLRDTDGDGVADAEDVLFTGFGYGDTHAVVSNLRWGLDGWIYGTQGYSGDESRHVTNAAGQDFGHIGNGVFRFRPDGSAIEVVSAYGSNTWGLDFSDEGELFFTMANGAHLRHVVLPERVFAGGRLGRVESWADCPDHDRVAPLLTHPDAPYAQIDFVGGFTAASGCLLYTGGAWPAEWRNAHFTCEPSVHLVHHDVLSSAGVTFRATKAREEEFLAGKDLWFRPVHLRVGPDGAMYLLDFYNQAIVHNDPRGPKQGPTNAALRPDRDHDHGRIWRVQHKRAAKLAIPDLARADAAGLARALEHPNGWVRGTAERLLVERGSADAVRPVLASASVPVRIAALWTLQRLGALDDAACRSALADPDPAVRANGARVAALARTGDEPQRRSAIAKLLGDPSERVRLEALVALGDLGPDAEVLRDVARRWSAMSDPWTRNAALRVAASDPIDLVKSILALHAEKECRELAAEAVRRASRIGEAAPIASLVPLFAGYAGADPTFVGDALDAIRTEPPDGASKPLIRDLGALLGRGDVEVASAALRLAQRWRMSDDLRAEVDALAGRLATELEDADGGIAPRVRALSTLLSIPDRRARAIEGARALLVPSCSLEELASAVDALAATDDPAAARALCAAYPALSGRVQDRIFEKLAARASWSAALLDAIEKEEIRARELSPQKLQRLRAHPDAAIAGRAERVLRLATTPAAEIEALIGKLLPDVEGPGDAAAGKELFAKNCASCHQVAGAGSTVGPDLTGMGAHAAGDLLTSILDPSRAVEPSYAEWVLETKDGRLLGGVLARESADSVLLRWSGGEEEVARAEIESMHNTRQSPMPMGFESLRADGLRDLIAYLATGSEGFRVLSLASLANASSHAGLYDSQRDAKPMRFARYGIVVTSGVPFEILDPDRSSSGCNAVVLKGGMVPDWECKALRPQRVEVPVGLAVAKVHVLGGIAAFGYPFVSEAKGALKWTWLYRDGTSEEVVLRNGVEIGDWIRRSDVPGSAYVEGLLAEKSWGQVRYHALAPSKAVPVRAIALESFDNELAPTVFAMTAELLPVKGK